MWGGGRQSRIQRARARVEEGRALERSGDREAALVRYGEAAEMDPKWALPHLAIGELELASGRLRRARDAFSRALNLSPDAPAAYWGRSRALRRLRSFRGALADLRKLGRISSPAQRGAVAAELEALECLVLLHELPESGGRPCPPLEPADARRLEELVLALDRGQARTAGRGIQALLDRYKGHSGLLAQRARAHLELGSVAQAVDDCVGAACSGREDPDVRLSIGSALLALGDAAGAERELTQALAAGGESIRARLDRARARRLLGDVRGAREDIDCALLCGPDHPAALVEAGRLAEYLGDAEAAEAYFRTAIERNPDDASTRFARARLRPASSSE